MNASNSPRTVSFLPRFGLRNWYRIILRPFRAGYRYCAGVRRRRQGLAEVDRLVAAGKLPHALIAPIRSLIQGRVPAEAEPSITVVEGIRARLSAQGDHEIPVLYSPKPIDITTRPNSARLRPEPGKTKLFTIRDLATQTSAPPDEGAFLHMCARYSRATTILELGACIGIGSSFLASSPSCRDMITVEGSPALAAIARKSIETVRRDAKVYAELFDDALDHILPTLQQGFDLVWIDGHHERVATLHYLERLIPRLNLGCLVMFDDIFWSDDMKRCWDQVCSRTGFSHCINLGLCGVCVWDGETKDSTLIDLSPFVREGNWKPRKPRGWDG